MFAQYEHGSVRSSDKMSCSIFEIFDWSEFSPSHKLVPEPVSSNQNDPERPRTNRNDPERPDKFEPERPGTRNDSFELKNDREQGTTVLNLRTTGNEERLEQGTSVHQ